MFDKTLVTFDLMVMCRLCLSPESASTFIGPFEFFADIIDGGQSFSVKIPRRHLMRKMGKIFYLFKSQITPLDKKKNKLMLRGNFMLIFRASAIGHDCISILFDFVLVAANKRTIRKCIHIFMRSLHKVQTLTLFMKVALKIGKSYNIELLSSTDIGHLSERIRFFNLTSVSRAAIKHKEFINDCLDCNRSCWQSNGLLTLDKLEIGLAHAIHHHSLTIIRFQSNLHIHPAEKVQITILQVIQHKRRHSAIPNHTFFIQIRLVLRSSWKKVPLNSDVILAFCDHFGRSFCGTRCEMFSESALRCHNSKSQPN